MHANVSNIELDRTVDAPARPTMTLHCEDGTKSTIVFSLDIAKQLGWSLIELCERLTPHTAPGDGAIARDSCSVGIQPPKEE